MTTRKAQALLTRRKLVDALKTLLESRPIESISIEEITKQAGVAKGTFYTHFKRKEDVVAQIAISEYDLIAEELLSAGGNSLNMLETYLMESVRLIEASGLETCKQWMKSVVDPVSEDHAGIRKYNLDLNHLINILKNGVESHQLQANTPVDLLATQMMNSYYGAVTNWCLSNGNFSLVENMEQFCQELLPVWMKEFQSSDHT